MVAATLVVIAVVVVADCVGYSTLAPVCVRARLHVHAHAGQAADEKTERQRQSQRQTARQRDRDRWRERERERVSVYTVLQHKGTAIVTVATVHLSLVLATAWAGPECLLPSVGHFPFRSA